jgi:hypothetical protein
MIGRNEDTMTVGLLLESAHVQQRQAEQALEALKIHTQSLDEVVRDGIRRILTEELQPLDAEIASLTRSAARAARHFSVRNVIFAVTTTAFCALIPLAVAHWVLPSSAQLIELTSQREMLTRQLQTLREQGAAIEIRHCGAAARLCVRIDDKAPRFGERAEFHVPAGY